MNNTELKGRRMLEVVSILYIVFSAITILSGLAIIVSGAVLGITLRNGLGFDIGFDLDSFAATIGIAVILASVLGLVVGILGVKWCARPDKAHTLFVLGIFLIVLAVLNLLDTFFGGGVGSADGSLGGRGVTTLRVLFTFSSGGAGLAEGGLAGLVLPVLYTLGAWKNKQSLQ